VTVIWLESSEIVAMEFSRSNVVINASEVLTEMQLAKTCSMENIESHIFKVMLVSIAKMFKGRTRCDATVEIKMIFASIRAWTKSCRKQEHDKVAYSRNGDGVSNCTTEKRDETITSIFTVQRVPEHITMLLLCFGSKS
jgi:hypothetical protein